MDEQAPDEHFDIEARDVAPDATVPAVTGPDDILTADKVAAVRFTAGRNGYSYKQVEHFVGQVQQTLAFLESTGYQQVSDIHALHEEIEELQERIATLQATIEVFRATGDPVRTESGGYLTESTAQASSAGEHAGLEAERDAALEALAAARAEADEAWAAEAEMRRYVEEDLLPWIASQQAAPQEPAEEETADEEPELSRQEPTPPDEETHVQQQPVDTTEGEGATADLADPPDDVVASPFGPPDGPPDAITSSPQDAEDPFAPEATRLLATAPELTYQGDAGDSDEALAEPTVPKSADAPLPSLLATAPELAIQSVHGGDEQ